VLEGPGILRLARGRDISTVTCAFCRNRSSGAESGTTNWDRTDGALARLLLALRRARLSFDPHFGQQARRTLRAYSADRSGSSSNAWRSDAMCSPEPRRTTVQTSAGKSVGLVAPAVLLITPTVESAVSQFM